MHKYEDCILWFILDSENVVITMLPWGILVNLLFIPHPLTYQANRLNNSFEPVVMICCDYVQWISYNSRHRPVNTGIEKKKR